jgi:hypothetical protein
LLNLIWVAQSHLDRSGLSLGPLELHLNRLSFRLAVSPIAASVLAVLLAGPAHATEVALTNDAHVNSTRVTTNFGTLANLYIGAGNTALLQFDLSTLPAGITASQVSRAILTVYVNRVNAGGAVTVSPVTSPWNELAVTFATIPAIGGSTAGFTAANAGVYVTLDVTALVQGWVTAPAGNNGLALASAVASLLLDSKENDETGHAPKLDITITSMGATGAAGAVGLQGIQGVQGTPGIQGATGAQGIPGLAGPTGLTGAVGINFTGAYSPATSYHPNDVVTFSNALYVDVNSGTVNNIPPTTPATWSVLLPQGAIGPAGAASIVPGPPGLAGPTGPTGPAGATGPAGSGGGTALIPPNFVNVQGSWAGTTTYALSDAVSFSGTNYYSLAAGNLNLEPDINPGSWAPATASTIFRKSLSGAIANLFSIQGLSGTLTAGGWVYFTVRATDGGTQVATEAGAFQYLVTAGSATCNLPTTNVLQLGTVGANCSPTFFQPGSQPGFRVFDNVTFGTSAAVVVNEVYFRIENDSAQSIVLEP